MYNPYSIQGKTILVTGASSGIGRCIAIECSKLGAHVIITGRNEQRLSETLSFLEGDGHQSFVADLTNVESLNVLVENLPMLDGLSHNAGISKINMIKFIKDDDLMEIMQTNTFSTIRLTKLLVSKKKLNKPASLVYTSSVSGNDCVRHGESLYAASKSSICGFAKVAALDLAAQGIRVNCVNPGMIETELFHAAQDNAVEDLDDLKRLFPLKRFGVPIDVAHGVIFLLSDASSWITGTELKIDGGYTLQ